MIPLTPQDAQALATLTDREREALIYVGKGCRNGEIADLMGIGVGTISDHLKSIFAKLDVDSRVEAAVLGCKAGWL